MAITGTTRVYGIIGDPVAQVGTPGRINPGFAARGTDAALVALQVADGDLPTVFTGIDATRNFDGLVFTMPHKIAALDLMTTASERAQMIGAVNVARRGTYGWHGDNLDGEGCLLAMRQAGYNPDGAVVRQVGAGGAGRSVAYSLAAAGARRIELHDIDSSRLDELAKRLNQAFPGLDVATEPTANRYDAVLNCSPVGSEPDDPYPLDPAVFADAGLVVDIILKPSRWLDVARAQDRAVVSGPEMVAAQMEPMLDFFLAKVS